MNFYVAGSLETHLAFEVETDQLGLERLQLLLKLWE
ncbi:hypothetical protein B6N60_00206 [Richelia sinica FACHB-800]|uniref:Uncharacterized protein n=1 Tax=Richelia sinica FACHB-800 TaxID=1357546 RepID=A0A975T404_9NOST|nr:hypothetical protein B6N60_00206 [Richelia sinica FACHB-800]